MANQQGWWKVTFTSVEKGAKEPLELSEADLEHIGKMVAEGYHEGEIVKDEGDN